MGVKLSTKNKIISTTFADMREGQIAIIIDERYTGSIVQYFGLVREFHLWLTIGQDSGHSWISPDKSVALKVRILEDGEQLTVVNNGAPSCG